MFFGASRTAKVLQTITIPPLIAVGTFFVWTKHCHMEDMTPPTDNVFNSKWYKKFNVNSNPTMHDNCVRRIPLFKLKPELVQDAEKGGSKLVEAFCQGVWGGFGYSVQRKYLERKYRNTTTTAHQLWTPESLLSSTYEAGTEITDHFVVLEKTPTSILIRCGDSPLNTPDGPRPSDGLFEVGAEANFEKGYAEFRLKSVFYQGLGKAPGPEPPMPDWMVFLHQLYDKLLLESAVRNVRA